MNIYIGALLQVLEDLEQQLVGQKVHWHQRSNVRQEHDGVSNVIRRMSMRLYTPYELCARHHTIVRSIQSALVCICK